MHTAKSQDNIPAEMKMPKFLREEFLVLHMKNVESSCIPSVPTMDANPSLNPSASAPALLQPQRAVATPPIRGGVRPRSPGAGIPTRFDHAIAADEADVHAATMMAYRSSAALLEPLPVKILQNTFSDRTHVHCTAMARVLIPAQCSAIS